ncbi:MAG: phosphopentomutase [Deltaproteobacteria bacterium]|nr:phosphopentomutase [Deltaproteobacteria bacterium]
MDRVVLLILDSVGIGELPDAKDYKDKGSNTLGNIIKTLGGIAMPNLEAMGMGLIQGVEGLKKFSNPIASYGRMAEASQGKDTSTGHWEITGLVLDKPFPTYPNGFPKEIMNRFKKATGLDYLGNRAASGTEIIKELGEEHIKTGKPIVYTSADSVFQIAAHEDIIPVARLYEICKIARKIVNKYNIGRVIARPFAGGKGSFKRSEHRKDFSLTPTGETILDKLKESGFPVIGIGKIGDIYGHRGLTQEIHTKNNMDGVNKTIDAIRKIKKGLIFTNLVDFDMLYGHRNDAIGYAKALEEVDKRIPDMLNLLTDGDMLIITADHGCDPTTPSTDHSREYVPLLVYGKKLKPGINLGTRKTFADAGQTIAEALEVGRINNGSSFLQKIISQK